MEEKSYGAKILEPLLEKFENMSSEEYNEKHEATKENTCIGAHTMNETTTGNASSYFGEKKKHKIELKPYYYECGDHCCSEWGTDIFVDGKNIGSVSQDADCMLQAVLQHFGIDCEVEVFEEEDNSVDYDAYLESVEDDSDEEETEE